MDIWHVRGGNRLFGSCRVQGSKNASLPVLAASIVFPARSRIRNVPRLRDADAAVSILSHLGCSVGREENELYIDSGSVADADIPRELMAEMRSSVIFMGALLARCGEARLSLPGGCQLGKRPIDLHGDRPAFPERRRNGEYHARRLRRRGQDDHPRRGARA